MKNYLLTNYARLARPVLAAALLLLLALAWLLPGPEAAPHQRPALLPATTPDAPDATISQWGSTALARPLFSPGRRPPNQAVASSTDATLPRLTAIIITGRTRTAVFAAEGEKPQLVSLGGTIAGYVMNRITPDQIELGGPAGPLTLHPQFSGATAGSTPATAPPPPPTPPAKPASPTANPGHPAAPIVSPLGGGGPIAGQTTNPVLNPADNPALMIEQNF